MESLELEIARWRRFVAPVGAVHGGDEGQLEAQLRAQIAGLQAAGLHEDEAFLIGVKRLGSAHPLSQQFAREHAGRLCSPPAGSVGEAQSGAATLWREVLVFAAAAAVAVQAGRLITVRPGEEPVWLLHNASLLLFPFLAGWFARQRRLGWRQLMVPLGALVGAAVVINTYPFHHGGATEILAVAHLPVVMWFVVAHPYMGANVRGYQRRMDFVRFTGEWCIYYVLIAFGGGILTGLTASALGPAGIDPDRVAEWVLPAGAAGAVIVVAWLVESKQQVTQNMAPVLTMLFTPLFAVMLSGVSIIYAVTGLGQGFDRELLGVFDALMVVVLGLVLYAMSARDPSRPPGAMDRIGFVAVVGALLLDAMVLASMAARIGDLGLTPNRVAALGLNLVLLVNLAVTAWLFIRFITQRDGFERLVRWQMGYLPAFPAWAATVVLIVPPAFAFS